MTGIFPQNTFAAIKLEPLIIHSKRLDVDDRLSSRLVKSAALLNREDFVGWQMIAPKTGLAEITVFGSDDLSQEDLEWASERIGKTKSISLDAQAELTEGLTELYELKLPVTEGYHEISIGFGAKPRSDHSEEHLLSWPLGYSSQFDELVRALRMSGAWLRVTIGSANAEEQLRCKKELQRTWSSKSQISALEYAGYPVRTRFLLRLPGKPSIRLRSVLDAALPGIKLHPLGQMSVPENTSTWDMPLENANVLPDYATRILMMEPFITEALIGIDSCEEGVKDIPASHKNTESAGAITVGRAIDTTGESRDITIGVRDLQRHAQIIGQTGTGKSTMLANTIISSIKNGYALTFFDPHGSTIDTILRSVPKEFASRIRVVRIGDAENPVPLNLWDSDDPEKEERNISDLCELFGDIFDPNKEGFVGPRWERWFSTFAKASIALLGNRASLESIAVISQNQDNMHKLYDAIGSSHPDIAEIIRDEYGKDRSNDFTNFLNWCLSKFQRLTSVEQLRKTLGAGTNALDFDETIDSDQVTLIDLASPVIGTHAARIIGTLLLMKLWNAALTRKKRDKMHIIAIDEASLFQNLIPRILAESRKFGISMILCHQHTAQLSQGIRDALEANSANFFAFRLSPRDAAVASIRFDDPEMHVSLARIDAFKAIATISVDGRQTAPFTLEVDKPEVQPEGENTAKEIELHSIETLVKPYQDLRALTRAEITNILNHPQKLTDTYEIKKDAEVEEVEEVEDVSIPEPSDSVPAFIREPVYALPPDKEIPDWLVAWQKKHKELSGQ